MASQWRQSVMLQIAAVAIATSACNSGGFSGGDQKIKTPPKQEPSSPSEGDTLGNEKEGEEVRPNKTPKKPKEEPKVDPKDKLDNDVVPVTPIVDDPIPVIPPPQPQPQPDPVVPPAVTPPAESEVGTLRFKAIPFVNMEHQAHATEPGVFAIVKSSSGSVVAAGPMTVEAACRGENIQSMAYPVVRMKVGLSYLAPQVASGQMSGQQQGTLSICVVNDQRNMDALTCQKIDSRGGFGGGFGDRPAFWYDRQVSYSISGTEISIDNRAGYGGGMGLYGGSENIEGGLSFAHPLQAPVCGSSSRNYADYNSPLVIDTNRNGELDLKNVWEEGIATRFDIRGNGQKLRTGWIKGDSLLALDLNGNGEIDSGLELFGEHSHALTKIAPSELSAFKNGFQALAQYDSNLDGRIDEKDEVYHKLVLWNDKNGDGRSQKDELVSFKSQVKSLSLAYTKVSKEEGSKNRYFMVQMNEVRFASTVEFTDGKKGAVSDVWFAGRAEQTAQAGDVK